MKLFVSAGEASGDVYGATLLREMHALGLPKATVVEAIGGKKLREAGACIVADSSRWGAIGISQAIKVAVGAILKIRTVKKLFNRDPGLFVAIDFGFANVRLAKHAKRQGWKVLYFMPPGSWRRDRQGADLPAIADAISTPFEWSERLLKGAGAHVHWYGHPIRQLIRESDFQDGERTRLAILPGSRRHEIELNTPLIAEAVRGLAAVIEFGVAPTVDKDWLAARWSRLSGRTGDLFTEGDLYGMLRRARAAVVCSGTATLEAALCGCPMVVVYKTTKTMHLQAVLAGLKNKFISLPNILLQRQVVPEFVGSVIDPANLRTQLDAVFQDELVRSKQLEAFKELEGLLGPDDAITRTAGLALSLLTETSSAPKSKT